MACGCVWQIAKRSACAGRPGAGVTVGWINSRAADGRARRGALRRLRGEGTSACPTPRPTAPTAAYHTHEYNWSITTARALSLSSSMRPSVRASSAHKGAFPRVLASRPPTFDIPLERARDAADDDDGRFRRLVSICSSFDGKAQPDTVIMAQLLDTRVAGYTRRQNRPSLLHRV